MPSMTSPSVNTPNGSQGADACADCIARREFLSVLGRAAFAAGALTALDAPWPDIAVREVDGIRQSATTIRYPLPREDGVQIDRKEQVILVRHAGHVYAFSLACPHQNTALRWVTGDALFQCPRHKSRYQPDGTFVSGRATRSMDRFAIRLVESEVEVALDHLYRQDENPAGWSAAFAAL